LGVLSIVFLGVKNLAVTIEDVAREAGVSITTVSRVVNDNYPVKIETRQRVEEAIKRLNYRPNPIAVSLVRKTTNIIGVIVPGISNMYFSDVVSGIEKYLKEYDYDVFLVSEVKDAKSEKKYVNKFIDRFVDGLIVLDPKTENILSGFYSDVSKRIPLVLVNGYNEGIDLNFVISIQEKGFCEAMEYLINLGHKKIAFVRGEKSYSYDLKENIYKEYMNKIKSPYIIINTDDGNTIEVVKNTENKIAEINDRYRIGRDITAFCACNDLMAFGILNGCSNLGLSVPKDVSVVGFDNIMISEMSNPKLTTVDQNMKTLGKKAAELIVKTIKNENKKPQKVFVDTLLIKRESCALVK
jgi:LacI family transcriptional regulator